MPVPVPVPVPVPAAPPPPPPLHRPHPLPRAILLRNALVVAAPEEDGPDAGDGEDGPGPAGGRRGRRRGRPAPASSLGMDLLPPPTVRLELVGERPDLSPPPPGGGSGCWKEEEEEEEETAVLASLPTSGATTCPSLCPPSLHPRWDRLDERCGLFRPGSAGDAAWDALYRSLRARIVVDLPQPARVGGGGTGETGRAPAPAPAVAVAVAVLAELPLHPTHLRRLPRSSANGDSVEAPEGGGGGQTGDQPLVPSALPPNALLVQYTDGSTRVDPGLYHRLLGDGVMSHPGAEGGQGALDRGLVEDDIREGRRIRRFEDDLFDVLAGEGAGAGGSPMKRGQRERINTEEVVAEVTGKSPADVDTSFRDDVFDLLGGASREEAVGGGGRGDLASPDFLAEGAGPEEGSPVSLLAEHNLGNHSKDGVDGLQSEVQALRVLLEEEEQQLQNDCGKLADQLETLRRVAETVEHFELDVKLMRQDTAEQVGKRAEIEYYLEALRAKFLRELRQIYPIQCLPDNVYTIRDLHLPADLHGPDATDAVVSAALGYTCHLAYMCSKYLSIPLRYRLFCNSSRSAIQDDGVAVYPLWREGVERELFDRAFALLGRDVECLIRARGLTDSPRSHILAKLDRLFEQTNDMGK